MLKIIKTIIIKVYLKSLDKTIKIKYLVISKKDSMILNILKETKYNNKLII